ncbi:uncharacterized protein EV420DRAFT_830615 [Desarmillaria tabescens]|uniref:RRM domain-containing protein n=1 Tax=Armillaria tabescens TaxID=1929756 RepID=A0AA39NJ18_ARMTA|nr:uncharacterized protein EV420DRAFT_830615 [Desarmillaria tabescens]KAK0466444.1 hypothetical protein EV420DRAFT_830615 [Desarmillaria tabescens]
MRIGIGILVQILCPQPKANIGPQRAGCRLVTVLIFGVMSRAGWRRGAIKFGTLRQLHPNIARKGSWLKLGQQRVDAACPSSPYSLHAVFLPFIPPLFSVICFQGPHFTTLAYSSVPPWRVTTERTGNEPIMNDRPYTLPEEDPFNITPLATQPHHRYSSLFDKWLQEQQRHAPTLEDILDTSIPESSSATPALLSHQYIDPMHPDAQGSVVTLNTYDFVEDDDIPAEAQALSSPRSTRFFQASRTLFSPRPPSTPPSATPTRTSFLSRVGTGSASRQHKRSSSVSTLSSSVPRSPSSSKWRPSVLGHFSSQAAASQASVTPSQNTVYAPSRPSLSSTITTTVTSTSDLSIPVSQVSFADSVRFHGVSHGGAFYGLNKESLSSCSSNFGMEPVKPVMPKKLRKARSSIRVPLSTRYIADANIPIQGDGIGEFGARLPKANPTSPQIAFSASGKGGTMPRVSFASLSTRNSKKKKLIVSGIGPDDTRRFEGVKRWCESFGEVSQIMRMPNGDLHVYFRSAEVADTVCRLRAKVFIAGVGSVNLSWYAGNKR